ncbi:hypothetical protein Hanom_Chr14g01299201 [Helianthus anomalus]
MVVIQRPISHLRRGGLDFLQSSDKSILNYVAVRWWSTTPSLSSSSPLFSLNGTLMKVKGNYRAQMRNQ